MQVPVVSEAEPCGRCFITASPASKNLRGKKVSGGQLSPLNETLWEQRPVVIMLLRMCSLK